MESLSTQDPEAFRLDKYWTQAELASHSGVSRRTIIRLERGEVSPVDGRATETVNKLAQALEIDRLEYLAACLDKFHETQTDIIWQAMQAR